jgi:TonB family protein
MFEQHPARESLSSRVLGVILAALLLAAPATAGSPDGSSDDDTKQPKILRDWGRQLAEADRLLREGEGRRAYKLTSRLLREMTDRISSGPEVGRVLGTATILRAAAAFQLGREDEARWHWDVALQLYPEAESFRFDGFGEVGTFLRTGFSLRSVEPPAEAAPAPGADAPGFQPPRKIHAPQPYFPAAKRHGKRVSITVQATIGKDGRLHDPHVLKSEGELTLVFASLETLREWRFEPLRIDGKPADSYYNIVVNFNP